MPFTVCMMAEALSRHRLPITFCGGVRAGASVSNASEAPGCRSLGAPPPRHAARRSSSHARAPGRASHQPVGRDGVHHLAHLHGDLAHGDCWGSTCTFEARRRSRGGHTERCARGASAQVEGAGGEGFGVSDLVAAGHGSGGVRRARARRRRRAPVTPSGAPPAPPAHKNSESWPKKKKSVGRKEGGAARPWIRIRLSLGAIRFAPPPDGAAKRWGRAPSRRAGRHPTRSPIVAPVKPARPGRAARAGTISSGV